MFFQVFTEQIKSESGTYLHCYAKEICNVTCRKKYKLNHPIQLQQCLLEFSSWGMSLVHPILQYLCLEKMFSVDQTEVIARFIWELLSLWSFIHTFIFVYYFIFCLFINKSFTHFILVMKFIHLYCRYRYSDDHQLTLPTSVTVITCGVCAGALLVVNAGSKFILLEHKNIINNTERWGCIVYAAHSRQ